MFSDTYSIKNMKQEIRRSMKELHRYCINEKDSTVLRDNFHIFHKAYSGLSQSVFAAKKLPSTNDEKMPRLYLYAKEFCKWNGYKIDENSVMEGMIRACEKHELQSDEIYYFPDIFKAALINGAAYICKTCDNKELPVKLFNAIESLRFLMLAPFDGLYEKLSHTEKILSRDSAYRAMDEESKNLYRHRVSVLADTENTSEADIAEEITEKASEYSSGKKSHIGYYLFRNKKRRYYIADIISVTAVGVLAVGIIFSDVLLALLSILPMWQIVRALCDRIYSSSSKTRYVPRMKCDTCPKTLVTIISLVGDHSGVDELAAKCEQYYLSNKTDGLFFGILADLPQSKNETEQNDSSLINYTKVKFAELNEKYDDVFFCAIRKRSFSAENATYCGKERKRGAINDFLLYTSSPETASDRFLCVTGNVRGAKYFTALDNDTRPGIDSVKQLVGVLEHPLAKPEYNAEGTAVASGYAIAAPRMDVSLASAGTNLFTRLIGGNGGTEIYGQTSFNIYQDIYGEGIFAGKGVINIDCYNRVMQDLFPDNTVLSHDILESGFLRTVYVSDVGFSDNVPKTLISYAERGHRWVRGDWQNISALLNNIKKKDGTVIKNPLSRVSKYKIFDNIRRSSTAPATLVLLFYAAFSASIPALIITLLSVFADSIFSFLTDLFHLSFIDSLKFRSSVRSGAALNFMSALMRLMCMPYFAYKDADAAVRAIYRMFKKKRLLEWTTADQADKRMKGSFVEYLRKMAVQSVGLFFIFRPPYLIFTFLWLGAIPAAWYISKKKETGAQEEKSPEINEYLRDMWGYFSAFINEKNNFLPPDNFQENPLGISAPRTSPTNIGIAMLCTLGAYDAGLIDENSLYDILEKMTSSVEKLDKYNGQLYNWYSTTSRHPLTPRYVSTVDNGNFVCFVYALKNGLAQKDSPRAEELHRRLLDLIDGMNFGFLYNKSKNLFYVGYDVENSSFGNCYYDIYSSEARLTSYYGIARHQIPKKHWKALSRNVVRQNGYIGVKSWSGTMFEYFMPHILLPVFPGSFADEALRFAISEQKKAVLDFNVGNVRLPWGISESGFYSFDNTLLYQYKAFGVPELSLRPILAEKKERFSDTVISPYSTFLTLPFFPKDSLRNLERLKNFGLYGKYGFYEALDCSFSRTGGNPTAVYSYMVHHVGMSFLSCVNYLKDNIMQKRFMDNEMSAYKELLEEKIPEHAQKFKIRQLYTQNEKYPRYMTKTDEYQPMNPLFPETRAIVGKNFTDFISDSGCGCLKSSGKDITRFRYCEDPKGIFALFRCNGQARCFTYMPIKDQKTSYKTVFEDGCAVFYGKRRDIETKQTVTVSADGKSEIREYTVKNNSVHAKSGEMLIYFEPVLNDRAAEKAHPAFSNLFIEGDYDRENKILFISRRPKDRENSGDKMCMAVGFKEPLNYEFELSRFNVIPHGHGAESLDRAFGGDFSCVTDGPVDPCVALKFPLRVQGMSSAVSNLIISCADNKGDAMEALMRARADGNINDILKNSMLNSFSVYRKLNCRKEDIRISEILLSAIHSSKIARPSPYRPRAYKNILGPEALWRYGISGDYPILLIKTDGDNVEKCLPFVRAFSLLKEYVCDCEMVFCFSEGGSYDRKIYSTLRDFVEACGMEKLMGKRSGIFLANIQNMDEFALLSDICAFFADTEKGWKPHSIPKESSEQNIIDVKPAEISYSLKTGLGGFTDNGFAISDKASLPYRQTWSHILANPVFGTLVTDRGLGFTFAYNAYKNKLTPWSNDPVEDIPGEKLTATVTDGKHECIYDITSNSTAVFHDGYAEYISNCGTAKITVKVFVPKRFAAKVISVKTENPSSFPIKIKYEPHIVMGIGENPGTVSHIRENKCLYFSNEYNTEFASGITCLFGHGVIPLGQVLCATVHAEKTETKTFILAYAATAKQARELTAKLTPEKIRSEFDKVIAETGKRIKIDTPDAELNYFFNTLLYPQIIRSRIYARTGFFQCSGAFGFRDQLQDACCVSVFDPRFLRQQIIRAVKHQFKEGDVMHWWHTGLSYKDRYKGVRSRSSDDMLWLPFAVCEYVTKTGDMKLLDLRFRYATGPLLAESESEKYFEAGISEEKESVFEHCKRALRHSITEGAHGMITFRGGDWNDGMNRMSSAETVWGSMFTVLVAERFADICRKIGDGEFADFCLEKAVALRERIEENCWDGDRYIRAIFPDGKKLGSHENEECSIDILPQSFASLIQLDPQRVSTALKSATEHLTDKETGIARLFTPAFVSSEINPGYIMGYISGIRENGGQYTHAAIWFAYALYANGNKDEAYEILHMINPIYHSSDKAKTQVYRTEPYMMTADIYTNKAHYGMGGWSMYTGAAGWYFKTVTEKLFGMKRVEDGFSFEPNFPEAWKNKKIRLYAYGKEIYSKQ